jgi:sugar-specific transcriptional regulator TrmB
MTEKRQSPEVVQLMSLGFSEYEARVYIGLLRNSPATAYEISKNTGIARANAYGTCESLVRKNAVEIIEDKPARFVPVPPEMLLSNIAAQTTELCNVVVKNLKTMSRQDDHAFIWSLRGEGAVSAKISEMIASAQTHIWIKAASELLDTHHDALRQALRRNKKLQCLIVLFGADRERFQFNDNTTIHLHEGSGARLGNADNLFTVTVDHKTALTARMGREVLGAYTSHEPVVTMAETIIRHDVYIAEIFAAMGDQIEKKFGPHLSKLRQRYFSNEQFALFSKNLKHLP